MGDEEKPQEAKAQSGLVQLATRFFAKEGYKVKHEPSDIEGFTGVSRRFDVIVQKGRVAQGVWIRDWDRTIGVNVVINLDKASEDVGLGSPILVGEEFSDHAKAYANRRKITLLTKRQMILSLR